MRVYIAADSKLQEVCKDIRDAIQKAGFEVTSRWLDVPLEGNGHKYSYEELEEASLLDLADIDRADVFLAYNPRSRQRQGTGGRHVEFGYAIAKGLPIIYVGEELENVHHYHIQVRLWLATVTDSAELIYGIINCLKEVEIAYKAQTSER